MRKLAIISTHPIQYNAPFFKLLAERKFIEIKVFYTWSQTQTAKKFDPGFGKNIVWDIPLLQGYNYQFVQNISTNPGSDKFMGIDNPTLIQEIKNWGANAVLVYGWNFKSHIQAMRYFKNVIPVLFRGDSTLLGESNKIKKIARKIVLSYVYHFINIALYAGTANKAYFQAHGLKNYQLSFMPHAVDNIRFKTTENSKLGAQNLRIKYVIPTDAMVFLFVGKLDKNKNVSLLIEAFIKLKTKNSFLLIVGTGIEELKLKKMAEFQTNIKFLGFQNQAQMPVIYATANVFVLPSKSETWGLSINEAMAAGKAVISSKECGAAPDLIKHFKNGLLFENDCLKSLMECLNYLIENEEDCFKMGEESELLIQNYTYDYCCKIVESKVLGFDLLNI